MLGLMEKVEHPPVGTTMMGTTRPRGVIKITVATCAASFLQFPNFKMKHITNGCAYLFLPLQFWSESVPADFGSGLM